MKYFSQLILSIFFLYCIISCGPSQSEKAVVKMDEAQKNIEKGDSLKAIDILKSIPSLFPKATDQIILSKSKSDKIYRQLIDTKKEQLSAYEKQITELEKNFTKGKTEFDMFEQYIPKKLSLIHSWDKSFLQVSLDVRGDIYLTSHYMGKDWLNHTSIKVFGEGLQVKTPNVPLNDLNNRESDFLEYKWEKVTYSSSMSDSTIRFIARYSDRPLKCAFIGKNYYCIILEDFNKEAIKDAHNLSIAIKNKAKITEQIKVLERNKK